MERHMNRKSTVFSFQFQPMATQIFNNDEQKQKNRSADRYLYLPRKSKLRKVLTKSIKKDLIEAVISTGSGLFASAVLNELADKALFSKHMHLSVSLKENARHFEILACNVMTELYSTNRESALKTLVTTVGRYNSTPLKIAVSQKLNKFMALTACQAQLNSIWSGDVALYTPFWRFGDLGCFIALYALFVFSFGIMYQAVLFPNSVSSPWELLKDLVYLPYWQLNGDLNIDRIEGKEPSECTNNPQLYKKRNNASMCSNQPVQCAYVGCVSSSDKHPLSQYSYRDYFVIYDVMPDEIERLHIVEKNAYKTFQSGPSFVRNRYDARNMMTDESLFVKSNLKLQILNTWLFYLEVDTTSVLKINSIAQSQKHAIAFNEMFEFLSLWFYPYHLKNKSENPRSSINTLEKANDISLADVDNINHRDINKEIDSTPTQHDIKELREEMHRMRESLTQDIRHLDYRRSVVALDNRRR
ncbi:TRPM3 [Mytilus coruscus]|uniref:TRPM3 n=1 Tax=Mytilus coruscus TaxID=42192 RepID=A0A6J8CGT9_MYTCO|nr:TRPM3 [Mytilus coruscus]